MKIKRKPKLTAPETEQLLLFEMDARRNQLTADQIQVMQGTYAVALIETRRSI